VLSPGQTSSLQKEGTLGVTPLRGRHGGDRGRGTRRLPWHKLCITRATVPRQVANQFGPGASTGFVLLLEDLAGPRLPRKMPARAAGPACSLMGAEHPRIPFGLIPGACAVVLVEMREKRCGEPGGGGTGSFPLVPLHARAKGLARGARGV